MSSSDASSQVSEDEDLTVALEDSGEGSDSEPESSELDPEENIDGGEDDDVEEEVEEVEEVEEEEVEEEEEIEEVEEEEEEEGEDQERKSEEDSLDSVVDEDDDRIDSSCDIESKGQDKDLRLEKTEEGLASYANCERENNVVHCDPNSFKPLAKEDKELPYSNDGDSKTQMAGENLGFSKVNGEGIEVQIEKEAPIVTRINIHKDYHEDQNGNKGHAGNNNYISADRNKSLCFNEMEVEAKNLIKDGFDCKASSTIPISQKETMLMDMESGDDIKLRASSSITPQLRPRSLSPGAEVDERNKKPAIICDFFAKGWCIKGSSCRFLHQKDGLSSPSKCTQKNVVVGSLEEYSQEDAGLRQEAEKTIVPSSSEIMDSSIENDPSEKSYTPSGRILLGEDGESKRWHWSYEEHKPPLVGREDLSSGIAQSEGSRSFEHLSLCNEFPWKPLVGEEYRSFGVTFLNHKRSHCSDSMDGKRLSSEELLRGYSLRRNNSISSCNFSSSGSTISSIYGNNNSSFGYGKSIMEPPSLILDSQSVIYNSRTSPELNTSLKSSFSASLPSIGISPSHRAFAWSGSSPSRSSSLPRNSSPFYSRSTPESLPLHVIPRDPSVSIGNMTPSTMSNWEPSVPFRPSFNFSSIFSSPRSQYDPLLDSIEQPNGGVRPFQASFGQGLSFQNTVPKQTAGDSLASQHPQSTLLNQSICSSGMGAYSIATDTTETTILDQQNKSPVSKEEEPSKPGHVINLPNSKKVDLDDNHGHQTDGSKHSKEAKMLKHFRASLVDLVKELVKPSWREGRLSKDAHNIIVRKAVDKVLNALQPHQIPSTTDSISQYLSSSRPKLMKLVEAYVGKYGKS